MATFEMRFCPIRGSCKRMRALYEKGLLPVQIGATFPLDSAVEALQEISQRRIQGMVVLTA